MKRSIKIGTRGSDLALWQANHVSDILKAQGVNSEVVIIKTKGDRITDLSFDKIEGKGFFTKEIEECLINAEVDLAVHSYKDLETTQPAGLEVAATLERGYSEDLLLVRKEAVDANRPFGLGHNAIVGTSSVRRKAQLLAHNDFLTSKDLRGNVPTRINKLREGGYDAIVLARAGVERLNLKVKDLHTVVLNSTEFVPAPAQGALALQIRTDDAELKAVLDKLNHDETAACVGYERLLLNKMDGGCHVPLGANCLKVAAGFDMRVFYAKEVDSPAGFFDVKGDHIEMLLGINELVSKLKR
jgi:hydroxymethylbilane synthase